MLSRTSRRRRITIIAVAVIAMIGITVACKKGPSEFRFVSQTDGTDYYVYSEPGYGNRPYGRIPCGDKIGIISRKTEKGAVWVETEMYGKKGWLLESALTADEGSLKCGQAETKNTVAVPGLVVIASTAEEAAAKYYPERYRKIYGDLQKQFPENYTEAKITGIIGQIQSKGISARSKAGNYTVITHGAPVGDMEVIEKADALWQKAENGWREYIPSDDWGDTIYLGHANSDSFPDAFFVRCVSDMCTITVYLGKDDGSMTAGREQFTTPEVPGLTVNLDGCGGTAIRAGNRTVASFDCGQNRLIMAK